MADKKAKKTGKGKKKAATNIPAVGTVPDQREIIARLEADLKYQTERASTLHVMVENYKERIKYLEDQLADSSKEIIDINSDMSRQYRSMKNASDNQINSLEKLVNELKDRLIASNNERMKKEKKAFAEVKMRDDVIAIQSSQIRELCQRFEEMLTEIGNKMKDKSDLRRVWNENHIQSTQLSESLRRKLEEAVIDDVMETPVHVDSMPVYPLEPNNERSFML